MEYNQNQVNIEVAELLSEQFPLPFVLVLVGYGFILLIDKVLIDSHDHVEQVCEHILEEQKQKAAILENAKKLE